MNRKVVIVALAAAMALTLGGLAWADQGCADCDGQCVDYPKRAHMPMLTAEQRDEVKARAAELDEQGASPEQVRAAIAEMLKEWGIQPRVGQSGQQAAPLRWGQRGMGMMQQGQRGMGMMQQGQRGMGMMQQGGQQAAPPRWGQQAAPPRWGQQAGPPGWGQQALGTTGCTAPLGTTGCTAPLGTTGCTAPLGTAGWAAALGTTGCTAPLGTATAGPAPWVADDDAASDT